MGTRESFIPQKLVVGILFSGGDKRGAVESMLVKAFGEIDFSSDILPFCYTHYYDEEMGPGICRYFVSFRRLVNPENLASFKIVTNDVETEFASDGKRSVNLDPGLLALSRFVLATTKDNAQRIALRDGIYAELTLLFTKKEWRTFPWTYPDYRSREYHEILTAIREIYRDDLKREGLLRP